MNRITRTQVITILATAFTLTVNTLANALPINGQTTAEISDRFDIYFVPAGYVFSIWGLIYLGLFAYTIYQALPPQRGDQLLAKIAPAYWLASLANSIWIFLWHYELFVITLAAMLTLLLSLIYIYQLLFAAEPNPSGNKKWLVHVPFSVYLGWISVATIANVSQVLFFLGWGGLGIPGAIWAVIMLVIAAALGLAMLLRRKNVPYALVLIWALSGIGVSQADTALVSNAAWLAAILLALVVVVVAFRRRRPALPA